MSLNKVYLESDEIAPFLRMEAERPALSTLKVGDKLIQRSGYAPYWRYWVSEVRMIDAKGRIYTAALAYIKEKGKARWRLGFDPATGTHANDNEVAYAMRDDERKAYETLLAAKIKTTNELEAFTNTPDYKLACQFVQLIRDTDTRTLVRRLGTDRLRQLVTVLQQ